MTILLTTLVAFLTLPPEAVPPMRIAHVVPAARGTLIVHVVGPAGPIEGAVVRAGAERNTTDREGKVTLMLEAGRVEVTVELPKMVTQSATAIVVANAATALEVRLEPVPEVEEEVVVSATRTGTRVQDEPMRVETLGREEIEEKLMMTPGDIAMMLNETAGLRVQVTSPSLGAASLRIQGLRGRYTQLLSDGLPLYGGQSGSIGLLQIPPMDLRQVEVIKGVASSLFGASALGGVVNLLSREPKATTEHEVLVNQTTQGATDLVGWFSGPLSKSWGYTVLANADHQPRHDADNDGWADVPEFSRLSLRPRLFWNDHAGRSVFFTAGLMGEDRTGGASGSLKQIGTPWVEALKTRRADAGVVARVLLGSVVLGVRGSANVQSHTHQFGDTTERDRQATGFGEVSLTGSHGRNTWVIGGALQRDAYRNQDVNRFDYTYWVPSLFIQDDLTLSPRAAMSMSARYDQHSTFGAFVSPRLSALLRPAEGWTVRISAGSGYFAPTPLTEETESTGLTRLASAQLSDAETARTFSFDVGHSTGAIELNGTFFGSRVNHELAARSFDVLTYRFALAPLSGATNTLGAEALAKIRLGEFSLVATHTYVHATRPDVATFTREEVPLTPRHSSGLVLMWEREGVGRAGVECYFTGQQRLEDNPYRSSSESYWYLGFMAERRVNERLRIFINAENLLDRRQTTYDPLLRPSRNFDGRWTVDAWAPLEGRVANAGIRWMF